MYNRRGISESRQIPVARAAGGKSAAAMIQKTACQNDRLFFEFEIIP